MKNLFYPLLASFCICLLACNPTKKTVDESRVNVDPQSTETDFAVPKMTFDKTFHEFGKIKKGEKREVTFNFTNTGNAILEIEIVTSCHCTTLDYPIHPIAPNEGGSIHAIFDSSEKEEDTEIIDITIILKNTNPKNGYPIVEEVKYSYELVK